MSPKFNLGQTVRKRVSKDVIGEIISEPKMESGIFWYRIKFNDQRTTFVSEESIELFQGDGTVEDHFLKKAFSDKESFSRIITYHKLSGGYQNNPTALLASKTLFQPHQYKPLLKFLYSSSQRLLIADEVGLGKTIEAGHILLELHQRKPIKTAFVICPKSICIKWQRELAEKFSFYFEIKDKKSVLEFLNNYEKGIIPPQYYAIISYQSARAHGLRERFREVSPDIDLVIFDEMHWARNQKSLTHKMVRQISEFTESVLGLTATPIMLGNKNLFSLLSILDPFEFQNELEFLGLLEENKYIISALTELGKLEHSEALKYLGEFASGTYGSEIAELPLFKNILTSLSSENIDRKDTIKLLKDVTELSLLSHIVTRTRRREVELKSERRSRTQKVVFTELEKNFYNAVTNYVREKYSSNLEPRGGAINFALMMPQRQVASCIPAMVDHYKRELDIEEEFYKEEGFDLADLMEDEDVEIDFQAFSELKDLVSAYLSDSKFKKDSKYESLLRALKYIYSSDPNTKILIFSYFRGTVKYLNEMLRKDGYENYLISGSVVAEDRQKIMDKFRYSDDVKILISTEVGSEGIDLEFCTVVVNYDLPWNPMVVEQRIGRIDRFGQKSEIVTVINFAVADTIEARILDRLYERIEIFKHSIGDLEDILGDEIQKLTFELLSKDLTPEEEDSRIESAANVIISKKLDAEQLEQESSILTNDEYFREELNAILSEKRYITKEELLIYLNEFLKKKFPNCVLRDTADTKIKRMYISDNFENELIQFNSHSNTALNDFRDFISKLRLSTDKEILVTLDSELAFENRALVFLNSYHPIIQYITNYYKHNSSELFPCSAISLQRSDLIEAGKYFYFSMEFLIKGGRNYKSLSHIIVDFDGKEILSESRSSELVAEILTSGQTILLNEMLENIHLEKLVESANSIALERFTKIKNEIVSLNESTIQKQTETTKRIFETKTRRINETISEIEFDPKRAKIVPALKGKLRSLERDYNYRLEEIEKRKEIEDQIELISAGFLVVKN